MEDAKIAILGLVTLMSTLIFLSVTATANNPIATDPALGIHVTHNGHNVNNLAVAMYTYYLGSQSKDASYRGTTDGTGVYSIRPGVGTTFGVDLIFGFTYNATAYSVPATKGAIIDVSV